MLCCVVFCQRFPPGRVNVCTVAAVSSCKKSTIDFPGETGREYFLLKQVMQRFFEQPAVLSGQSNICGGTVVLSSLTLVEQSDETRKLIHANLLQPLAPAVVQRCIRLSYDLKKKHTLTQRSLRRLGKSAHTGEPSAKKRAWHIFSLPR